MTDCLTREFRAQLTTAMDSVLRRAVFEITRLFENSLHDHQMELAQKGEEVAQLRVKLQAAELRLRERQCGGDGLEETDKAQVNETQGELEVILNPLGQTSDVPEIDFEVPDDWCAPLGSETVIRQDDDVCPSIRLRPLMIPLWRIPVIKQEEDDCDIDSHQQTNHVRRSKRGFSLNNTHKHTQDKSTQVHDQGTGRRRVKHDMKNLLQDIKREYCDQTGSMGLRRRGANLTGKEQENTATSRKDERKITATESESTEQPIVEKDGEKRYSCKFCKKVFDTVFGRSVHVRLHRRCRGCKKEFPFPSILGRHKPFCKKFKKLLAKEALHTSPPQSQSRGEEKSTPANRKQVILKRRSSSSPGNHNESSAQKARPTKKHCCARCGKKFSLSCRLKEHTCARAGEKPFPCSTSQKKFHMNQPLRNHKTGKHLDQMNSSDGGLARTDPEDDAEDNREDSISPRKDTRRTINHNKARRERSSDAKPTNGWQTMGVRRTNGFSCLLCQKLVGNKYLLIEHFRIHTGERPLKCERCHDRFRTRQQLCNHRKRYHYPVAVTQCEKCKMRFQSKAKYNKHAPDCPESRPNVCTVCGRGFFVKGRLRNHMERCHS